MPTTTTTTYPNRPTQFNTPKALTFDEGKPPLALLPYKPLGLVADVLAAGLKKYAPHNWRKGLEVSRNSSCALRHIYAFLDGEDMDPELGTHHIANAACRLLFILETLETHPELDDRYRPSC